MMVMTFGQGMSSGTPDVCKLPPFAIPTPYPNIANNGTVVPTYFTIMLKCQPELNIMAQYAVTSGDEPGAMGGVVSQMIVGTARPLMGSIGYFVGGGPVWRLTAPTMHNLSNAPGNTVAPSQTFKTVLS